MRSVSSIEEDQGTDIAQKISLQGAYIAIRLHPVVSEGGLILPNVGTGLGYPRGRVVAAGPHTVVPIGAEVLINPCTGHTHTVDGFEIAVLSEAAVIAILAPGVEMNPYYGDDRHI